MNVLVSSNNKFLKPLLTSLYSLSYNTCEKEIHVYFINVSVDAKNMEFFIEKSKKIPKIDCHIININPAILSSLKIKNHFSIETYSRLLLANVLPNGIDKIMWLDADTIIHNSIDEFYNIDCTNYSIVACKSINQADIEVRNTLNLSKEQLYFNAGIILFNVDYIRKNYKENYLIDYAIKNNGKLKWLDQDVLNAQFGKTAKVIDYTKYNYMHFSDTTFSKEQKIFISKSNSILHYIGAIKPWNYKYNCFTFKFWKKYAIKSRVYSKLFFLKYYFLHWIYLIYKKIR